MTRKGVLAPLGTNVVNRTLKGHEMGFFEMSRLDSQKRANGIPIRIQVQTFLQAYIRKRKEPGFLRFESNSDESFFFFFLKSQD